jgi:hypothetical protein
MKDLWANVIKEDTVEYGNEKVISKKELLEKFEYYINEGGWKFISWSQNKKTPYQCIVNDGTHNIDILLYLKNITNAGWANKPMSKRIQVGNDKRIDYSMLRNQSSEKINLIIGYYDYNNPIFAAWKSEEYTKHKTNRSCYIDAEDIMNGYKDKYIKTVRRGQELYVFTPENLVNYIKEYIDIELPKTEKYIVDKNAIISIAKDTYSMFINYEKIINKYWDGKEKILEMKNDGSNNWRQMEWPGFYFEFIGKHLLDGYFNINGIKYGKTTIDLFNEIPWDLKAHTINSSNHNKVQTNSLTAIHNAVDDYGYIGFILLEGEAEWDDSGEFKEWHDNIKEKLSEYVLQGLEEDRGNRRRKKAFKLKGLKLIIMNKDDIEKQPSFQKGMKNSNGNAREEKMLLDLSLLNEDNLIIDEKI